MCPLLKTKTPTHPLLEDSFFNSLYVKCVSIMTHDVLNSNNTYIICTDCYKPEVYNRVLTRYSHTFQYGTVPPEECKLCRKLCRESRPLQECAKCLRAYHIFIEKVTRANQKDTYKRLVGLSVNSGTLDLEYGIVERRSDPNDLETLAEALSI